MSKVLSDSELALNKSYGLVKTNLYKTEKQETIILNVNKGGIKMSVVIVGGNECMIRRYKDACLEYGCSSVKSLCEAGDFSS